MYQRFDRFRESSLKKRLVKVEASPIDMWASIMSVLKKPWPVPQPKPVQQLGGMHRIHLLLNEIIGAEMIAIKERSQKPKAIRSLSIARRYLIEQIEQQRPRPDYDKETLKKFLFEFNANVNIE
jgi:hypothetical protein